MKSVLASGSFFDVSKEFRGHESVVGPKRQQIAYF